MAEPTPVSPPAELPKPRRFLTTDEAVQFLGLRGKSALKYLHQQPDPPPCIRLSARNRVYDLADLQEWASNRKSK